MHYMMMPLDQHFDGGLGATGEAFEEAAKTLAEHASAASHPHLPINFLHRHAIELFLKSMIVVMHRALGITYGEHPHDGQPFTLVDGKWKPLHCTHSVAVLWKHVQTLFHEQAETLRARCGTDWQATPEGLDAAITAIEEADGGSTFFRYPDGRNRSAEAEKSSWKSIDPAELLAEMQAEPGTKPVKMMLMLGPDRDEILQAFQFDDAPLSELSRQLRETSSILSSAHTGLRLELADGC